MGRLTARLDRLEQRRPRPGRCPEHTLTTPYRDYRACLRPFLPPEMQAEIPELELAPPCSRCGWRWEPAFDVVAREDWGQHGPA